MTIMLGIITAMLSMFMAYMGSFIFRDFVQRPSWSNGQMAVVAMVASFFFAFLSAHVPVV
jgi:hypothetical protein